MLWWHRMNSRVGLCVGTLNALAYIVVICSVIYTFSYWTTQIATSDDEQFSIRLLNRAGHDLEATGMIKVARAIEPLPVSPMYFKLADFAGLLYQNPQLDERLADYPPFIGISQRQEFQDLGHDADFHTGWQNHAKIGDMLGNDHARAIWLNKDEAAMIREMVSTNLDDLENYLQTGVSQKFDDPILGRWHFNVVSTIAMKAVSQPNFNARDVAALRAIWTPAYAHTDFIAAADGQLFMQNFPRFKPSQPNQPPQFDLSNYTGQWSGTGVYDISLADSTDKKSGSGQVNGARLTLKLNGDTLIFDR